MVRDPRERIHPKALTVWRLSGAIAVAALAVLLAAAAFVAEHVLFYQVPLYLYLPVLFLLIVLGVLFIFALPSIRWRRWRYEVREKEIEIQHGIWIIKRTLIPMARVQHVDTRQGPLLRAFGLASVDISTAAGAHEIPALGLDAADELRNRIAELAGVADDI
ncbi:MAG: hypothetical protein BAA01_00305 [Bacillus thermozeamaize]|uniref:YdbS-like PH domain-containing protein n=1 Tax=Bacillus thermozeamaize TaxID=230954 RepID=A0A1Y3PXJ6_9BACI|nr:MAG: hypothetical protein BAA01_00305 [Bacillus thermozeamaize]